MYKNSVTLVKLSQYTIDALINYYLSLEKGEFKTINEIVKNTGYSKRTIVEFIVEIDKEMDVNGQFNNLYKLILSHTKFRKYNIEGSNWYNQQIYFNQIKQYQKRMKAKQIALSLYQRQQSEKNKFSVFLCYN